MLERVGDERTDEEIGEEKVERELNTWKVGEGKSGEDGDGEWKETCMGNCIGEWGEMRGRKRRLWGGDGERK